MFVIVFFDVLVVVVVVVVIFVVAVVLLFLVVHRSVFILDWSLFVARCRLCIVRVCSLLLFTVVVRCCRSVLLLFVVVVRCCCDSGCSLLSVVW